MRGLRADARLADDCADAAAAALGREPEDTPRALSDLLRALNRAKDGARLRTSRSSPGPRTTRRAAAGSTWRTRPSRRADPAADAALVDDLCGRWLEHEARIVRAAASTRRAAPAGSRHDRPPRDRGGARAH